jgi:hypothetical protein
MDCIESGLRNRGRGSANGIVEREVGDEFKLAELEVTPSDDELRDHGARDGDPEHVRANEVRTEDDVGGGEVEVEDVGDNKRVQARSGANRGEPELTWGRRNNSRRIWRSGRVEIPKKEVLETNARPGHHLENRFTLLNSRKRWLQVRLQGRQLVALGRQSDGWIWWAG